MHPGSDEIVAGQNQLNSKSGIRRKEFNSAHGVQTFHIECHETVTWIEDKMRVLEQADELKIDLTGIMTLQHFPRLSSNCITFLLGQVVPLIWVMSSFLFFRLGTVALWGWEYTNILY